MLAIITGTIRPPLQMSQLTLRDEEERFRQYEESICSLINSKAFSEIVFCENSGYGTEKLSHLMDRAEDAHIKLELLSFQGDTDKICIHGKGYGEGEIMDYVFSKSRFAKEASYFVKITGRLKVDNIQEIVVRLKQEKTYFNIPNRTIRDIYDTRIYAMPADQFQKSFRNVYEQVMDGQGIFLEHVYTQVLKDCRIRVTNFPRYPRIVGMSGSGGIAYSYTEWKCRIRDVLGRMNLYKVK